MNLKVQNNDTSEVKKYEKLDSLKNLFKVQINQDKIKFKIISTMKVQKAEFLVLKDSIWK